MAFQLGTEKSLDGFANYFIRFGPGCWLNFCFATLKSLSRHTCLGWSHVSFIFCRDIKLLCRDRNLLLINFYCRNIIFFCRDRDFYLIFFYVAT